MSLLRKFVAGFRIRTSRPTFEVGERLHAFVTGYDRASGEAIVRIGDTELRVDEGAPDWRERLFELEVTAFDPEKCTGTARVIDDSDGS